jgi:ketosteroid isomerase-like protein
VALVEDAMPDCVDVVRELYEAVAAGDGEAIAARLAPDVRWQARDRGPQWRRRRAGCSGAADATASMLLIGRKLPTVHPRSFHAAGDRVLVGLWADTMEGRPTRWWTVLTVRGGRVTAVEDHTRHRDALRSLATEAVAAP